MKLTIGQVEARLTAAWGKQAFVIPYRLPGNRTGYIASDHEEHWLPLLASWVSDRQVFEPVAGAWPEPKHDPWLEAVLEAYQLAQAYFVDRRNRAALRRLPRALVIAEARQWTQLGDELDTWLIPSSSQGGVLYQVNGRCTCPDYLENGVPGGWCKHRLARALAKRAAEILKDENGAGSGSCTPAPHASTEANEDLHSTRVPANGQARRIDLIVAYKASEATSLAHMNGNGHLVRFLADGQEATPPAQTPAQIYRWLQEHGFVPADFKWLGWEHGLRQRRQTYVREVAQ